MGSERNETKTREGLTGIAKDMAIWIDALSDETDRMNDWERNFITDMSDKFDNGENFSVRQIERLKEVYDKYF